MYRGLFETLAEAVQICELVFDDNGDPVDNIILSVNAAFEKHTGLKRDEVIGKCIKEILPVVEQVWLERHGGRVWVESELGNGSTFYFTIPSRE